MLIVGVSSTVGQDLTRSGLLPDCSALAPIKEYKR